MTSAAEARPYTLEWDASTDGVTVGYRVYVGTTPGIYSPPEGIDVGNVTEFNLNLTPGLTYWFAVRAYNAELVLGPPSADLVFAVPNGTPVLTNPGTQVNAPGNVVSLNLVATDADGDGLIFTSVTGLPPGLNANAAGQITGTINAGGGGVYSVTATVSDGSSQDVEVFSWRVIAFAASPGAVISPGLVAAIIGSAPGGVTDYVTLAVAGTATNVFVAKKYLNGQAFPPAAPITDATITFDIGGGSGNYELRFFRNDTTTLFAMAPVTVTANQSPQVTPIPNRTDQAGSPVNVPVAATDPDGSYANAVLSTNPVAYWRLNENSGTMANDYTGRGRTLTYVNTPTLGVAGAVDGSTGITLDGINEYAHAASGVPAALQIGGAITLEAWIKTTKPNHSDAGIVGYGILNNMHLVVHNDRILCYLYKSGVLGAVLSYTSASIVNGAWHSVSCTWNGTTNAGGVNLYVDGVVRSTGASATAAPGSWPLFEIGRATSHFQGSIDDVAVYNVALTPAQVLAHHEKRTLSYSATGLPTGLNINSATGAITGTPTAAGIFNVTISVSDGVQISQTNFTWTILANLAPIVTPLPTRSDAPGPVSFQVVATDPDAGYAASVSGSSPFAYWRLNESSGTIAFDSSGQGRTATLVNGVTLGAAGALADATTAASFDGVNDFVAAPNLNLTGSFTLEAWVYYTGTGFTGATNYGTLFGYAGDRRILVHESGFLLSQVGGESWFGSTPIPLNTWTHVVYRYDAALNQQAFFVNGAAAGTDTPTTPPTWNAAFRLGDYDGSNYLFKGRLDEVAAYNVALTAGQIAAHFAGQTLTYSATGLPAGMSIDSATGVISGTAASGNAFVTVTVTDGVHSTQTSFMWKISAAPTVTPIANRTDATGSTVNFNVVATDPDGGYASAVLAATPVGYWQLNESSGTSAADSSGFGWTGIFTNGVTLGAAGALPNATTAVSFDGVNDFVAAPNLNLTGSFTLEAWVYYTGAGFTGATNYGTLFGYAGDRRILVHESGFLLSQVGGESWFGSTPIPLNTWTHVVYRYDAALNQQAFFVNGAAAGTDTPTTPPTWNAAFRLGDYDGSNYLFKGRLDEVAAYNVALTAGQIAAHFAGQTLTYSATGLPAGMSIDSATGVISGTAASGNAFVTVTVTDGVHSTQTSFMWKISAAPTVTPIANRTDATGSTVNFNVVATDPDGGYASAVLAATPVGYWQLNESSGTSAADSSGFGWTGIFTNGVTLGAAGALPNATTAVSFDGVNDFVAAPNLNLTGSFTLEAWVYYTGAGFTGATNYGTLFGYAGDRRILVHESGFLLSQVGGESWFGSTPIPLNTWTHVVYRYDAALNQQAFFVNGAAAGTDTPTTPPTWNAAFRLGDYDGSNYLFKGRLDEVAAYNVALTAGQIAAHFAGQTLTYSATGLPAGVTINTATGVISGTPTATGVFNVTVTVSDGIANAVTNFTWTILDNQPPTVTPVGNQAGTIGVPALLNVTANDPDGGYAAAVRSALPQAYWRVNESSGTSAADTSGHGRTATYTNGVTLGAAGALPDATTAVSFDGVNDFVAAPNLNLTGSFTLESWVYYSGPGSTGATNYGTLFGYASDRRILVHESGFLLSQVGGESWFGSTPIPLNTWTHVVYRHDAALNQQAFFVNGAAAGTDTPTTPPTWNAAFRLGDYDGSNYLFKGRLDEVAAYNVALTAAQIAAHFAGQTLSYSATGLPTGLSINTVTGAISGTPAAAGIFNVTVTVSDGISNASTNFTWTIGS